ncbi:aldolase [Metabacillus endolithicus]|nr:aldolase [Metabacillus endolithicus]UPG65834.1 aldolase [Metabacillus endolithicus]
MLKTTLVNKYKFKAFGLNIISDFYFSELPINKFEFGFEDIVIEKADLTLNWKHLSGQSKYFTIKNNLILVRIPNNAIYMIENGNKIYYSPMENVDADQLRLYLLGTCMGALLLQRRILPLHGSAIEINGKAYAIVGDSGAGKSTLASALLRLGYHLISDDVIPVTISEQGIPLVTPAYPQQKLWVESLNQFGMKSDSYSPLFNRETKFAIPVTDQFASKPLQLEGIIELSKNENDNITLTHVTGLQKLQTLYNHTYRNLFIAPLGLIDWHFNTSTKICEQINMFQLKRPTTRFSADELAEAILSTI